MISAISSYMKEQFTNRAMLAGLLLLMVTSGAQAAVSVIDDAAFGTGTVLRDAGKLDYLRLDQTMGYGYAGIEAELGAGGVFDGWSIATTSQMLALGASVGLVHAATSIDQLSQAGQLRAWFCPYQTCVNTSSTHVYSRGLVADLFDNGPDRQAFSIGERFNVSPPETDFRISGFGAPGDTSEEVFLVRPVPLPGAAWLMGSCLLGFRFKAFRGWLATRKTSL